jgi:hypothetical protein
MLAAGVACSDDGGGARGGAACGSGGSTGLCCVFADRSNDTRCALGGPSGRRKMDVGEAVAGADMLRGGLASAR